MNSHGWSAYGYCRPRFEPQPHVLTEDETRALIDYHTAEAYARDHGPIKNEHLKRAAHFADALEER